MDKEIFVISLMLDVVKENGKKETIKLIGLSPYTDDEYNVLIREGKTLGDILADGQSIKLSKPIPLNQAIAGDKYKDIVELIRDDLRNNN